MLRFHPLFFGMMFVVKEIPGKSYEPIWTYLAKPFVVVRLPGLPVSPPKKTGFRVFPPSIGPSALKVGLFAHLFVLHTFSGWHRASLVVSRRIFGGILEDFFLIFENHPKKREDPNGVFVGVFFERWGFVAVSGDIFLIFSYGFLEFPWDFPKIL